MKTGYLVPFVLNEEGDINISEVKKEAFKQRQKTSGKVLGIEKYSCPIKMMNYFEIINSKIINREISLSLNRIIKTSTK